MHIRRQIDAIVLARINVEGELGQTICGKSDRQRTDNDRRAHEADLYFAAVGGRRNERDESHGSADHRGRGDDPSQAKAHHRRAAYLLKPADDETQGAMRQPAREEPGADGDAEPRP